MSYNFMAAVTICSDFYLSLTSFKTILVDYIMIVVLSVCIVKKIKIGESLHSYFNIEDTRK